MSGSSGASPGPPGGLDVRLVPLAVAAWAGAWVGLAGPRAAGALAVGAAMSAVWAAHRRSPRALAAAAVLLVAVGVAHLHAVRVAGGPIADLAADRAVVSAVVTTTADPVITPAGPIRPAQVIVRARLQSLQGRGQTWALRNPVLVSVGKEAGEWRTAPLGTTFAVSGRLRPTEPGEEVAAVLQVRGSGRVVAPPGLGLRLVHRVRSGLRDSVAQRSPDARGLVPALVLGDTAGLSPDLVAAFKVTGLTHLTAVSGANLTLLLAFMLFAARWLGVRGWWLRAVGLAGVVVFVGLCRTEPSVLRAAAMGLVALAALGAGGARAGPRNLSVAVLLLVLIDPFLARSYGFALSVLASGGIIWWARRWAAALAAWLPVAVAEAVSVPLAAQLATGPVVAQLSGSISVVALIANALAGPFVGPATVLGFAAAGCSLISADLAAVAGAAAAWSAQPIIWIARLGAELPGAAMTWPVTAAGLTWLAVAALAAGWLMAGLLARRWLVLVLSLLLVLGLTRPATPPGWPPRGWIFVACEVGQGDGLVVKITDRQAVLVDTGPDPPAVLRCLDQLGVEQIPLLVLTHFHADHMGGAAQVLDSRPVQTVWVSPLASPAGPAGAVRQAAAERRLAVVTPAVGSAGAIGPVGWQVLGPARRVAEALGTEAGTEESAAENDASLVLKLTVQGMRLLLTGDVEPAGQRALLAGGADLRAEVLKVPHHGSSRQEPAFFAATQARYAVASAGPDNDYGHPAPRTVALATSLGMTVLRTDVQGSVAVVSRDGALAAVTQRAGASR